MSKKKKRKKSDKKQLPTEYLLLITAALELARVIFDIIWKVLE